VNSLNFIQQEGPWGPGRGLAACGHQLSHHPFSRKLDDCGHLPQCESKIKHQLGLAERLKW
jgi:hypothetical protein